VHRVTFDDGEAIQARSVVIATGARYNRLPLDRLAEFRASECSTQRPRRKPRPAELGRLPFGGGNSAGQAALFLSRSCVAVHLIIRGDALDASMSRYLVDRIERNPGIIVWPSTQVRA
jgi:thioredoxin reductase (NADPH)